MTDSCANISFQTMPDFCIEVPGESCLEVTVVDGGPGQMNLAQFTALMNAYNAALLPFLTNELAFNTLGSGKEFVYAQGSPEAPQGIKAITYAP